MTAKGSRIMKKVDMYTDGSCKKNPGPGGYACILVYGEKEKVISGGAKETTNNRMELSAVIEGLKLLKEKCAVNIFSDSKYVIDAVNNGWAVSWRKKGWKKADGKAALNSDLWEILLSLCEKHVCRFDWVKGHNGHEYNERCDALAQSVAEKYGLS